MKTLIRLVGAVVLVAALPGSAPADEKKPMVAGQVISATSTVEAVDTVKRTVTLKGPDGKFVTVEVPDYVKRLSEVKVGDQLTIQYSESFALKVAKAAPDAKLGTSTETGVTRSGKSSRPGAVVSHQTTATVEVVAVDAKAPSITIRTADGSTRSFPVRDPTNLEGVKAGDHIVVTYQEALAVQVKTPAPPKAAPAN